MAKNEVTQWDTTAANNTDVGGISIAEGMSPGNVNNAMREIMAQLARLVTGVVSFPSLTVSGFMKNLGTTAARLDFQTTSLPATHERFRVVKDTTGYAFQTGDDDASDFVTDYRATVGPDGVTDHEWSIEGTPRFSFDADSYTFGNAAQARTALGVTATAGSPTIIDIGSVRVEIGSGTTDGSGGLTVTWAAAFSSAPRVFVSASATSAIAATFQSVSTTAAFVQTWVASSGAASASTAFNYIAIGPKA